MEFNIGQTFTGTYPPEAAAWCNQNNAYIEELEPQSGTHRFQIHAVPEKNLEELKVDKVSQIDAETSAAIIAGFDYTINGTSYHFSYDSFDQQNFSDTANMCQLAISGAEGLPTSVTWNSYLSDGTLVQQIFDANKFLELYVKGAMAHKATQMAIGGQRKAAVQLANTEEELDAI